MPTATAKTPACVPSSKSPPRINAPGMLEVLLVSLPLPVVPGPPKQLRSPPAIPVWLVQSVQLTAPSAQSATHSSTLPTMSKTPQLDLQFDREPVFTASPTSEMLQSEVPSSVPGSGVPAAAPCHSRLVSSRLADSRQAWTACGQLMQVLGGTPATEPAYSGSVQLPVGGKVEGYSSPVQSSPPEGIP